MVEKGNYGIVKAGASDNDWTNRRACLGFYYANNYWEWSNEKLPILWFEYYSNYQLVSSVSIYADPQETSILISPVRPFTNDEKILLLGLSISTSSDTCSSFRSRLKKYITDNNFSLHVGSCSIHFTENLIRNYL